MTSLVLELQAAAINQGKPVDELLRMAIVVATKLKLADFRQWCEKELRGYGKEPVPSYRRVHGELKARNPFHGWIPVMVTDSTLMEELTSRDVGQSVSELEHLLSKKNTGGTLHIPLPHQTLMQVFGDTQEFQLGMVPTLMVSSSEVHGIVASVRDAILQWSLKLEQEGILGDGMTFSGDEVIKASHVTYNIQSFAGVLGNVESSNVQVGDYGSIHTKLKQAGVSQSERNELEQILDELPAAIQEKKQNIARRGVDWVVRNGAAIGALSETIRAWFEPYLK